MHHLQSSHFSVWSARADELLLIVLFWQIFTFFIHSWNIKQNLWSYQKNVKEPWRFSLWKTDDLLERERETERERVTTFFSLDQLQNGTNTANIIKMYAKSTILHTGTINEEPIKEIGGGWVWRDRVKDENKSLVVLFFFTINKSEFASSWIRTILSRTTNPSWNLNIEIETSLPAWYL